MAKLYLDKLEPFRTGQDHSYGIDVYDIDTGKRFARIVPTPGGHGSRWNVRFFDKPCIADYRFEDILAALHEQLLRQRD